MIQRSIILVFLMLAGCQQNTSSERWYTQEQIDHGRGLFVKHCSACHGDQAQGLVEDWQSTDADGFYPPPPLNGSAHAWHHPLPVLTKIIREGGKSYDGRMPGFSEVLSESDQYAIIAWVQSQWSDEIYQLWQGERNRSGGLMMSQPDSGGE